MLYYAVPWIYARIIKFFLKLKVSKNKTVVLTFDDGPGSRLTPALLDKLKARDIKATFFLLGKNIPGREDILRRIDDEGHEICCHSYSHLNHWAITPGRAIDDMHRCWQAINDTLGKSRPAYPFRPPHGKLTLITMLYMIIKKIPICYWTLVSGDTYRLTSSKANRVAASLTQSGGAVFLSHDFDRPKDNKNEIILRTLDRIIETAEQRGMRFMTFSELNKIKKSQINTYDKKRIFAEVQGDGMDVTVIIVNWNTRELLYDCLKSLETDSGNVNYEVIVVDNNSSDGSTDMVRKEFPYVRLIENEENLGFAAANNQGIAIAKGRYVLLLNSDTLIKDNVVEKTVAYADQHKDAATVGCQVRIDPETVQMTCFRFPSLLNIIISSLGFAKLFKYNRFFGRELMLWWKRDTERHLDAISGVYMLVRREAIEDVGLMDDSYFFYYEETDWCYRFNQAGWKTLFYPYSSIIHIGGGGRSSAKAMVKMFVQQQKSLMIYLKKHYGPVTVLLAKVFLSIGFSIRALLWSIIAAFHRWFGRDHEYSLTKRQRSLAAVKYIIFGIEP